MVMVQSFVRYRPEIEKDDPNFEKYLQTVLSDVTHGLEKSVEAEGIGRAVRTAHGKGYGLARGEVEILSNLPSEYAQGIYAHPGRHEAMVRFSNGTAHVGSDAILGAVSDHDEDRNLRKLLSAFRRDFGESRDRRFDCKNCLHSIRPLDRGKIAEQA